MTKHGLFVVGVMLFVPPFPAHAGDPEAHTVAMIKAANEVAMEPAFAMGVGAPLVNKVPVGGMFKIPMNDDTPCPYTPTNPFGAGCAYQTLNGRAINEPDNWACLDERQPEIMNHANGLTAPMQAGLAAFLAARVSEEAAMACNWTHFTRNPLLASRDADAATTFNVVNN